MGRTTIDIVKLTFALASNTKAITQEAINQIQEVEEAGKDIKINLSDENIQSQAQHIVSLLEGALKKIDIGKLPVNFITDLLNPDVTLEQNNANLTHLYDRLVDISKLPDDIREKLSGMPSIDWDEIFNIDQEDLQASKESLEDYVVSEKEAIEELNALLEERNALQDQIAQKQKKLDANNSGKKPISQKEQNDLKKEIGDAKSQLKYIELEELKYFTRIRSLNSSLTDNQFNNHLDETELIADENDIKRYNSVIARAFEESNTAITEHIEALRSIKDISDFDNWYKTKHVTQNINDYLDSVDTKKIGERLDKSVSASGIGLSLDVSDEEVAKFLSEIQRKIDASKGIRLKIQLDKVISDIESALKNHGFVTNLKGKSENNKIKPTDILSILSGWNSADSVFIDKNKTFANYRERGMAFNSQNGEYTNPYAYSGHGEFNMNKEILAEYKATHKDVKDLRGAFDSWIHTHPSNKATFSGQDYVSMAAKRDEYGINHHYVMGKDEVQYLDITDISTADLKELGKIIDQVPRDYLDKNKDAENKFYSGENFKNFLQAEGTFEKATANLASFLQKFSKQLLPLVTDNASAKGRVGDLVTNYGKSRDLAQNILNSVFSDTSLQGSHNYIDTSIFKKAIANYFWKAIGLDESSFGNLDFSGAIQADENRAVTEFLRFRTLKPSDKQRYMPDEAINAINEYAYDVAYNFLKNLKNEQGFDKYNVDDIMKKFTVDDFLKNNPMGLSTAMLKNIKGALNKDEQEASQKSNGSEKKDGYKKLEESLTPLKESIDKLSTNLESIKTPLENLSSSLAPVFDNINNSGILNNQAEPTQDDIENIKERIKKAIEEEKYQLKLEVSDDEIANFINSISSKISNTKGISLKINTDNLVQQVRDSFKGQKISTEITPQDSSEKVKVQTQEFDDAILNRPVDLKKNKQYINKFFTENKDKNVLRYGGEIFQSYLKSDKNYSNFSSELSKYLGPKILEALVKMGSTSPEVLSKLKQIESSAVMDKIISTAFDNKHIKGEKNYVNQEKYNESILKTLFKYLGINANKGKAIKADLLNTINTDEASPLNKAVSGFVQFDDKYSLYPKELLDALTRYINQSIELDKQKSKQKEERNPKNVPWDKNPRNPASKNFDPNTIPVGKRDEINAKRVSNGLQPFVFTDAKEENKPNAPQQKTNTTEDNNELKPIASNISELKDAISENTTAVNGLTKVIGDINNGVSKTNENRNTNTANTNKDNAVKKQEEVTEAVKETTAELEHQNNLREESVATTKEQVNVQKEVSKEAEVSTKNGYASSRDMFLDAEAERGKNKQSKRQADVNRDSNEFRAAESGKNYRESMSAKIISGYKELETLQVQLQDMYLNGTEESAISSQIAKINEKKSALQELISKIKELNEAEKSEQNNYNSDKYNPSSKNNYANDFINNKFNNYEDIANTLLSSGFNGQTRELEERINRINQLINEVREKDGLDITNKEDVDYLNNIENKIKTIFSEINNKDNKNLFNVAGESSVLKELTSFQNYISKNTRARGLFGDRIDNLQEQANILVATPDKISIQRLKDFRAEFIKLKNDISAKGVGGISFFDKVSERLRETGAYFASFVSVYQIIGLIKQCANTVVDLNSKLIELSKVSNTSIADLEHQFQDFKNISKEVGGTISDTIQATADWSRNGYGLPDSKELAKVAQIYKNVGDGININEANESLISTLRGYELEAKDALSIVDKINEVANTQPIDSGGLGEALQRSAASFRAANTSLSESIALITASNSVVQDPKRVGNMWKTNKTVLLYRNVHREYI